MNKGALNYVVRVLIQRILGLFCFIYLIAGIELRLIKEPKISMKNNSMFFYDTPIGRILIEEDGSAITQLYFCDELGSHDFAFRETALLKEAGVQLNEYFTGKRKVFDLPIATFGTAFQQSVWKALRNIPYGQTRSYGQIARAIGNEKACRAVGMANHKNPISIIIPCHRVIGSNGKPVGYGGGLNRKSYLLELEKRYTGDL